MDAISTDASGIEHSADFHLGVCIFSSDCCHVTASLFRSVDVCHYVKLLISPYILCRDKVIFSK
jgi:hypothetical protein